ncbi:hypothetical protein VNO78_21622 [Psophocarpus tetragonolobus]|uniref:Cathepsin propeptide inhibitor domain-containing protein n=1 Tax=Psophocarpus tetragonolobus TaxID=3891 RepID=A0AAN9XI97_PSOTE
MATLINSHFLSHALLLLIIYNHLTAALDMSIIDYDEGRARAAYEAWLVKHRRSYNTLGEEDRRFEIFWENMRFVEEHNGAGDKSFTLGLNRFADLTNKEYRAMFLGTQKRGLRAGKKNSGRYVFSGEEELPAMVDWRQKGAVATVKDQGQCG